MHIDSSTGNIFVLLLILTALSCASCSQDSALSEVQLDDPGLLQPKITLTRDANESGTAENKATVYLYDRNNDQVQLNNGGISVDGVNLVVDYTVINHAPYYRLPTPTSISIKTGTTYVFTITMGDGSTHNVAIATQSDTIDSFTVPPTLSRLSDLNLSWSPVALQSGEKFCATISAFGTDYLKNSGELLISDTENANGNKVIAHAYYDAPVTTQVVSMIYRQIDKTIPAPFAPGGTISSLFTQNRLTTVTD